MESSLDAALGKVAVVLRLIGAVWMVVLATVYAAVGDLRAPTATVVVTAVGVGWAVLAWRSGWIDSGVGNPRVVLGGDLAVTCIVILAPGLLGETAGFSGGYPFAALVVGLAMAGRRGVVVAAVVLTAATLASLGAVGAGSLPDVVSNLLFYALGAVALAMGADVIRANEQRTRQAEAALAVAEERTAMAAHLHDSVLQTLALVQRRADDAGAVRSLSRRQERELRDWLFPSAPLAGGPSPADGAARSGPAAPGGTGGRDPGARQVQEQPVLLGPALERHAEEVEERYGVAVAVVMVGGAGQLLLPTDEREGLCAVVLAAREAMTNAAVHAGVDTLDLYAETDAEEVAVYVRDRGTGFDLDAVAPDRQGVRGSIIERMERSGGSAVIRATPGRGTEVQLRLPRDGVTTAGDTRTRRDR